ncbi:hypothetical protein [Paenibacillus spongiae]|uniref:HNH nuclease domain-containing protein n=1 Tax=Paenibacillus spongiae TaxID=2909671 RepID=A0ABY5SDP2_9BACL|nr:hypothetical protein [Paenibacillus spongiae]UVI32076.1 hypothetical protein L1F29_09765 [Paenibacillus spongiae]
MNNDRLQRLRRVLANFKINLDTLEIINLSSGKVKQTRLNKKGYPILWFSEQNKSYGYSLHEVIAVASGMDILNRQINHLDGNKQNSHPSNLEVTDAFGNMKHAYETGLLDKAGLYKKGSKHRDAKISEDTVIEIRRLYAETDMNRYEIAEKFNISYATVSSVINKATWGEVTSELAYDPKVIKQKKKVIVRGEKKSKKLNEQCVLEIYRLYLETDLTMKEIGKKYSIKDNTVCNILNGKTWTHIYNIDPDKLRTAIERKMATTRPRGTSISTSKLNEESVKEIRSLYEAGQTIRELSEKFGVGLTAVRNVVLRLSWTQVKD